MCTSSVVLRPSTSNRTFGSFPRGCMRCPLAVLGATLELARLSMCSPIIWTKCGPAAQMSAPESRRTSNPAWPLREVAVARIMGAGLDERFDNCECCSRRPYVRGFSLLGLSTYSTKVACFPTLVACPLLCWAVFAATLVLPTTATHAKLGDGVLRFPYGGSLCARNVRLGLLSGFKATTLGNCSIKCEVLDLKQLLDTLSIA